MTTKDKEYIDRQHNQLNGRLATLEDRIAVVEGKSVATTDGSVKVELDKDQLREIISELLNKHKLVKENELNCLIDIYNDLVPALNRSHLNAEKRFELIRQGLMMLLKPDTATAGPNASQNAGQDVASNAAQNVEPKADTKETPNVGKKHGIFSYAYYHSIIILPIRNYFNGHYRLRRNWTLLTIILYLSLLFIALFAHISIIIR